MALAAGSVQLPAGRMILHASLPFRNLPTIVFLHGLFRHSGELTEWFDRLTKTANVIFVDLPGHGSSDPIAGPTLENVTLHVRAALTRALPRHRMVLVGESFGGLVALSLSATDSDDRIAAVLAVDPPLVTKKQLHVHGALKRHWTDRHRGFFKELGESVFGLYDDRLEDRIYYDLIGSCSAPITFLTGDCELFPPRPYDGEICCLDAVDRYVIENAFTANACLYRKEGAGHLLLKDHPDWCLDHISAVVKALPDSR